MGERKVIQGIAHHSKRKSDIGIPHNSQKRPNCTIVWTQPQIVWNLWKISDKCHKESDDSKRKCDLFKRSPISCHCAGHSLSLGSVISRKVVRWTAGCTTVRHGPETISPAQLLGPQWQRPSCLIVILDSSLLRHTIKCVSATRFAVTGHNSSPGWLPVKAWTKNARSNGGWTDQTAFRLLH